MTENVIPENNISIPYNGHTSLQVTKFIFCGLIHFRLLFNTKFLLEFPNGIAVYVENKHVQVLVYKRFCV